MTLLWAKSLHLIAIIAWFSGLFYLPRLFVYHAMAEDVISKERFKIMERRLYYGIMAPSIVMTFISGFWLISLEPFYLKMAWLPIKLVLVVCLTFFHLYCGHLMTVFKYDRNCHSPRFYRCLNECPTLFLIAIVILAVVKPF